MTRKKPEQIVKLLRKADEELAKGKSVEDFCREEQISPDTYYRWQRKYGGLQFDDAKRLKALEVENAKLGVTQSLFRMRREEKVGYGWQIANRLSKYISSNKEAVTPCLEQLLP